MARYIDSMGLARVWETIKNFVRSSIPVRISTFLNDIGYTTAATDQLLHYYKRSEVYSKEEIDLLINEAANFSYVSVEPGDDLPEASERTKGKLYLYEGHRWVTVGDDPYEWVDLGSYDVNMEGFVNKDAFEDALSDRPVFQKITESQMQSLIDAGTWVPGVLYYSVEDQ